MIWSMCHAPESLWSKRKEAMCEMLAFKYPLVGGNDAEYKNNGYANKEQPLMDYYIYKRWVLEVGRMHLELIACV